MAPKKPAVAKFLEKKGSSAKLTTKLEKKESAAKLAATSKMLLEYGQPVFIPDKIPFCLSCEQRFGEPDKDSTAGEILKWRVFQKRLINDVEHKVPATNECQPCWASRRKDNKGCSQADVVEQNQTEKKDVNEINRRKRVRGIFEDGHAEEAKQLSSTKANYKDKFVENHFCPLDTYLQTHASGVSFPSKKSQGGVREQCVAQDSSS